MDERERYTQLSIQTAQDLRTIARSLSVEELSSLTLPEVDRVVDLVARMVPAGNVPGVILNGLARLKGRKVPAQRIRDDIDMLFNGVEQMLDKAIYGAFFAGPAAVIWGYQNLLKLAGKSPEDAFPGGVWQFYADYALREDTARHANETHGFDTVLCHHGIQLSGADRITAWVMTAIHTLHGYDDLLENEWRERTYTHLLSEVTAGETDVYRAWRKQLPYARTAEAADVTYPAYRRLTFDAFLAVATEGLRADQRREWKRRVRRAERRELPAYQRQMSILAYLEPGLYGESHVSIPLRDAYVGVIHRGHYYLIPACAPSSQHPPDVERVRAQVAAITAHRPERPSPWPPTVARVSRVEWTRLRDDLSPELVEDLHTLRLAPILINTDRRPRDLPLAELRQTARGVGDHALTLFDTGETFVFDQSHIFFDGAWGATLAEIMTNEALSWAVYLRSLPALVEAGGLPRWLRSGLQREDLDRVRQAEHVSVEVSAEADAVNLKAMLGLRRLFKQRSDLLSLTVNDLLILYRAVHAARYAPSNELIAALRTAAEEGGEGERHAVQLAFDTIASSVQLSPPILIPVDATPRAPRDRVYPMTFEVPLEDLELLDLHDETVAALRAYREATGERSALYAEFDRLQRAYLAALAGLGQVLGRAKEIAREGETAAVGTLKMLAHMPAPLQRMLDQIPGRFDVLNDLIKGREVFSNVGAVAPSSTLTRFITAKDDNEKKTLAWGVITDAKGGMRITLRDFRPHVAPMVACGQRELAKRLAEDYVGSYARGLNVYIQELLHVTRTSRETRLATGEIDHE